MSALAERVRASDVMHYLVGALQLRVSTGFSPVSLVRISNNTWPFSEKNPKKTVNLSRKTEIDREITAFF